MNETFATDGVSPQTPAEIPEVLREPTQAKGPLFVGLYSVACMMSGTGNITVASVLLPIQVTSMVSGNEAGIFSLILGAGAVAAMLTNPLAGMLSDRTTSRLGRRRPWLIAGGVLIVLSLLLMAIAPSLPVVTGGYICLQIAVGMVAAALSAIIPDQVPIHQRATVSAFAASIGALVGGILGQTLVTRVFTAIPAAYTSLAVAIAIMLTLFLLIFREQPLPREHIAPFNGKSILTMLRPLTHRDFALTWVARCLMFLGYTTIVTFMLYFLRDTVQYTRLFPGHTAAQGVQIFFAINAAVTLVASLLGGILSDKLQRRKIFVIVASVLMAVALLLYAFFPIWSMVLVGTAVLGVGMGIFFSVDTALASQVLPAAEDRGKDMGIINAAVSVPMILSPLLAGITLSVLHSYLALFALLAVAALFAAVLIVPIKGVR